MEQQPLMFCESKVWEGLLATALSWSSTVPFRMLKA